MSGKTRQILRSSLLGPLTEAPGREGERETNASAFDISPSGGGGPLTGPPAEEVFTAQAPSRLESKKERFQELREIWRRPWADDDAADRQAFELACQEVAPDDIIEAAKTWVAAFEAGDGVRF